MGGAGKELTLAVGGETFQFPLTNTPAANVLNPSTTSPACPGLGSGQAPAAVAGNLCLYVTSATNVKLPLAIPTPSLSRFGFGIEATAEDKEKPFTAYGQWAVTAP